ncbi:MAG: hypothetical protein A2W04_10705 [Betaproteobacteria bacterium RBG_16_64_9]|nr:MAG: hypothetical protein A2W04_10705 [Betaproteobacteria bacterium RBG_16_64_9]
MNDSCTGWGPCSVAMPSSVTMLAPSRSTASIRQEFTIRPFITTAHEPHSPTPQPSLVVVYLSRSLRISMRVVRGSTAKVWRLPLITSWMRSFSGGGTANSPL